MARIPEFKNEQEEADFWDTHSVADYLDELTEVDPQTAFPQATHTAITLRLPRAAMAQLKTLADQQGVDPRTLLQTWTMGRLAVLSVDIDRTQANPLDAPTQPVSAR